MSHVNNEKTTDDVFGNSRSIYLAFVEDDKD